MATPYDTDGSGSWTVAGLHSEYSPKQWEQVRASFHKKWYLPTVHIADRNDQHKPYGRIARAYQWWLDR